ncbi:MAG: hypothetical protein WCF12_06545 [Propionicimonas sp.]
MSETTPQAPDPKVVARMRPAKGLFTAWRMRSAAACPMGLPDPSPVGTMAAGIRETGQLP